MGAFPRQYRGSDSDEVSIEEEQDELEGLKIIAAEPHEVLIGHTGAQILCPPPSIVVIVK